MPRKISARRQADIEEMRRQVGADALGDLVGVIVEADDVDSQRLVDERANRRMERWNGKAGLGPLLPAEAPGEDASHWLAVAIEAGRGTSDDTTALRVARRGFACPRYRDLLRRTWRLQDQDAHADYDPYGVDEDTALNLGEAVEIDLDEGDRGPLDQLFRSALAPIRRRPGLDDNQVAAAISDMAVLALGGLPIEERIPATGEGWPHIDPDVSPWLLPPGPSPRRLVAALVDNYMPEVVAAIPMTVEALKQGVPEVHLTDEELGDVAALLAPMQTLFVRRMRAATLAWARTGGAWRVDHSTSSPHLSMVADALQPADRTDRAPKDAAAAVVDLSVTPDFEPAERLVLRRNR
jgi:hypothetical protein